MHWNLSLSVQLDLTRMADQIEYEVDLITYLIVLITYPPRLFIGSLNNIFPCKSIVSFTCDIILFFSMVENIVLIFLSKTCFRKLMPSSVQGINN